MPHWILSCQTMMVKILNASSSAFFALIWLFTCLAPEAQGQGDVYKAAVKITGGGPAVVGFLYAVNDTAIVILPSGKLSRKGFKASLAMSSPISIPLRVVKKVKVMKVRSMAHDFGMGVLLGLTYSIAYVSVIPISSAAGLIPYTIIVSTLALATFDLLYSTTYKPKNRAFKVKMQKYCVEKDELAMDR
jgi:hypothetical protein